MSNQNFRAGKEVMRERIADLRKQRRRDEAKFLRLVLNTAVPLNTLAEVIGGLAGALAKTDGFAEDVAFAFRNARTHVQYPVVWQGATQADLVRMTELARNMADV